MNRKCPNCSRTTIPVSALLAASVRCSDCDETIAVRRAFRGLFALLTVVIAVPLTLIIVLQQGIYAALLLVTLPVGALAYVKARFCPLSVVR
jgi:uncharacterized protein (DUF983 family)